MSIKCGLCTHFASLHRHSQRKLTKNFSPFSVPCMGISYKLKTLSKFACVSLFCLAETLLMCVFQANRCSLFWERGKGNPCSGITTSKVSTVSPDGNSRPQNTGMNTTFSLVVTSFIQKDTLVKAEVGEYVTRDALSVRKKNTHFLLMKCKVLAANKCNRSVGYK